MAQVEISLPSELNYTNKPDPLPNNTVNRTQVVNPNNGTVFGPAQYIQIDLPAQDFADPNTFSFRYQSLVTNGTGVTNCILGTPCATPFTRMEMSIGGILYDSIADYNIIYDKYMNYQMNYAQKCSAPNLGYVAPTTGNTAQASAVSVCDINGSPYLSASVTSTLNLSGQYLGMLSTTDTLVPLFCMPKISIRFYTDTLANMFNSVTAVTGVLDMKIQNFEFVYDTISFGHGIEQMVKSMSPKLIMKTQSWGSTVQTVQPFTGSQTLVYNQVYRSIKSLFSFYAPATTPTANKKYDSVDITKRAGNYCYYVSGIPYPSRMFDTLNNKAGGILELKQAVNGSINTVQAQNMSMTGVEWDKIDNDGTAPTVRNMGKFVFAANTERMNTKDAFLTGISSASAPINLTITNNSTVQSQAYNVTLFALYDVIIEVDPLLGQVVVLQ